MIIHGIYKHACPNCEGEEDDARLLIGLPCPKCLPKKADHRLTLEELYLELKKHGTLRELEKMYKLNRGLREVDELFNKATGSRLWSVQRAWVKRVLKGRSFTIIAPTGVGKTVFGIIMSLYIANKGGKAYIIEPTTPLVTQVYEKLVEFAFKAGLKVRVVVYHAKLKSKDRKEALERIEAGDFDVLVTTSAFLSKRFESLRKFKFDFIFVDDVDAILKSSKNIDRVLILMGYSEEEVAKTYELVKVKSRVARLFRFNRESPELKNLLETLEKLSYQIEKFRGKVTSVLVVSSATGRPRGLRVRLFRELLGFDVGSRSELLRNVVDTYYIPRPGENIEDVIVKLISKLGRGGLIFVPIDRGIDYAKELAQKLLERNIRAEAFSSENIEALSRFIEGENDILVGVAFYYGVMVRGLDLPEHIRYAIFTGIPKFKFSTKLDEPHPMNILRGLTILSEVVEGSERRRIERLIARIRRYMQILPTGMIAEIREKLAKNEKPTSEVEKTFYEALNILRDYLQKKEIKDKLMELEDIRLIEEEGKTYILIPDVMTYIQASGRTSRMFAGGLTKGLSIVITDDEKLLRGLIKRTRWIVEDIEWKNINEVNLDQIIKEINRDREIVKKLRTGEISVEFKDPMKTALMIVESPNKARTIANFFGKPSIRRHGELRVYEVSTGDLLLMITASGGHIYDLVIGEGYHGVRIVNGGKMFIPIYTSIKRCLKCGHQFTEESSECPRCGSKEIRDSLKTIEFIKELCSEVDVVLIGTDPDTEGEKIGWDLAVLLMPYSNSIRRIEFHEVTKRAIMEAIKKHRDFDENLVEAQIVRRIEDRWIGFELSMRLWKAFERHWLSAGRVQTPVLGWIIERAEKYRESIRKVYRIFLPFNIIVEVLEDEAAEKYVKGMKVEAKIEVEEEREEEVHPPPPYTTDSYLQDASRLLGLTAPQAMQIAQDLFELGFITYHRTDSIRVSSTGQVVAREYLSEKLGEKATQLFIPRSWSEAGAHECIRPTRPMDVDRVRELIAEGVITPIKPLTRRHYQVYDMIFRRFMASQMKPAKVVKQKLKVEVLGVIKQIERVVEIIEPGFLTINPIIKAEERAKSGVYEAIDVNVRRKALVPLYSHGDVIRLMRERGIGRPSTYAKIIQTLLQRGYVMETKRKKLLPTDLGVKVYNYLSEKYPSLVSESRTALLEKLMDQIERGERNYLEVLRELYQEITSINHK